MFHVSLLRRFAHGGDGQKVAIPIIIDGEAEWEVEQLVRHLMSQGKCQYLVRYRGFDMSEAVWLDETDLTHAQGVLADYKVAGGLT